MGNSCGDSGGRLWGTSSRKHPWHGVIGMVLDQVWKWKSMVEDCFVDVHCWKGMGNLSIHCNFRVLRFGYVENQTWGRCYPFDPTPRPQSLSSITFKYPLVSTPIKLPLIGSAQSTLSVLETGIVTKLRFYRKEGCAVGVEQYRHFFLLFRFVLFSIFIAELWICSRKPFSDSEISWSGKKGRTKINIYPCGVHFVTHLGNHKIYFFLGLSPAWPTRAEMAHHTPCKYSTRLPLKFPLWLN